MSQLTCIACQRPIYRGQRAISLEFGNVEQSQKSQRDVIRGYAVDMIHFECIHTYLGRIDGELYNSIIEHQKQIIRKQVVADLRDELKQEAYDELIDEFGRTCAVCNAELSEIGEDDEPLPPEPPVVQSAMVKGPLPQPDWPQLPTSPFTIPPPPIMNGQSK